MKRQWEIVQEEEEKRKLQEKLRKSFVMCIYQIVSFRFLLLLLLYDQISLSFGCGRKIFMEKFFLLVYHL